MKQNSPAETIASLRAELKEARGAARMAAQTAERALGRIIAAEKVVDAAREYVRDSSTAKYADMRNAVGSYDLVRPS